MARTRQKRFEVKLTTEENRMLRALAKKSGLTAADVVRQLIRERAMRAA